MRKIFMPALMIAVAASGFPAAGIADEGTAPAPPEGFFPLDPAAHVQPLARRSSAAVRTAARAAAPPSSAASGMTVKQARQLLSLYFIQN